MTISPVSHNTRPESQLLPQEAAAFDLLDKLGIEYDRVSHDAAFNMELCAEVSRVLDVSVCKKSVSVQPAENRVLSAVHAAGQALPH